VASENKTTGDDFLKRYSVIEMSLPSNVLRSKSCYCSYLEG
jgi:hypothetical protein